MKAIALIGLSMITLGSFAQTDTKTKDTKKATTEAPKEAKSVVQFKTLVIDKGEIPYGADVTFDFEFKNTGKEPLMITDVRASCGCTTPQKPTEAVAKGKSDKIVAKYDTKRQGEFTKTITVTTNIATEQPIVLTIKGKVLPPVVEEKAPEGQTN